MHHSLRVVFRWTPGSVVHACVVQGQPRMRREDVYGLEAASFCNFFLSGIFLLDFQLLKHPQTLSDLWHLSSIKCHFVLESPPPIMQWGLPFSEKPVNMVFPSVAPFLEG